MMFAGDIVLVVNNLEGVNNNNINNNNRLDKWRLPLE